MPERVYRASIASLCYLVIGNVTIYCHFVARNAVESLAKAETSEMRKRAHAACPIFSHQLARRFGKEHVDLLERHVLGLRHEE